MDCLDCGSNEIDKSTAHEIGGGETENEKEKGLGADYSILCLWQSDREGKGMFI